MSTQSIHTKGKRAVVLYYSHKGKTAGYARIKVMGVNVID